MGDENTTAVSCQRQYLRIRDTPEINRGSQINCRFQALNSADDQAVQVGISLEANHQAV
jgi:hypothetical protein